MICNVGSPGMVLTVWLVARLLTLCGGLACAKLGAMLPMKMRSTFRRQRRMAA